MMHYGHENLLLQALDYAEHNWMKSQPYSGEIHQISYEIFVTSYSQPGTKHGRLTHS